VVSLSNHALRNLVEIRAAHFDATQAGSSTTPQKAWFDRLTTSARARKQVLGGAAIKGGPAGSQRTAS
jgi:hypothetical protein